MTKTCIRFDLRTPSFGTPPGDVYAAALDMIEFADQNGFHNVKISEHHNIDDGYLPSPLLLGAAAAARTRNVVLEHYIIATLHNPVRLAEELAVLDRLSQGRAEAVLVAGYRPSEFAMFDRDMSRRAQYMEELFRIIRQAWRGEPLEFDGHQVLVTPRPLRPDGPPLLMGGSVATAAKRAARLADGFLTHLPDLHAIYVEEAKRLGRPYRPFETVSPGFVHVTRTPEKDWEAIGPSAMYETNSYSSWAKDTGVDPGYTPFASLDELKASGAYAVVTPEEAVEMAGRYDQMVLHPLCVGLDPALGWSSMKLYAEEVLPRI